MDIVKISIVCYSRFANIRIMVFLILPWWEKKYRKPLFSILFLPPDVASLASRLNSCQIAQFPIVRNFFREILPFCDIIMDYGPKKLVELKTELKNRGVSH